MNIRHAKHYEPEERTVLIRYNPERSNYYWCNVNDGDIHGSTDSNYVAFTSLCDCIDAAKHFGYEVIVGDNPNKKREENELHTLAEYIDTCVSENFDINETPEKFDTLRELINTYAPDAQLLSVCEYRDLMKLCSTDSILRLVK